MPGPEADDLSVEVTADSRLALRGELRGALKGVKEQLVDEWTVGPYERYIELPGPLDGEAATITYGSGVLVVALPVARAARGPPASASTRLRQPAALVSRTRDQDPRSRCPLHVPRA